MSTRTVLELVGAVGVIGSLIFVGLEIRQSAAATRAATVQQIKDAWLETNLTTATSRDLADAFVLVETDSLSADLQSVQMVRSFLRVLLHNWSNAYWHYRNGSFPEDQWRPHFREMESRAGDPLTWWMWNDVQILFDDDFRSLMDSLRAANGH